ncbi:M50 family metallopeptidase [Propionibacterium freudenreichii]|uniref:M50 family metallopeptidase n=1 Tax=Propionibacterium freudenreichii TaxID=1744 RepID=UPI000543510C|nr:M50 family metallopeptidase [Propionibacterium freudenreichii]CEH00736.1 membrane protein [Propionibacterium freudenreichii]
MDWSGFAAQLGAHLRASVAGVHPDEGWWIAAAVGAALVAVVVRPVWRWTRIAVTIVHELGHAVVGLLSGRKWQRFVVHPDMSGEVSTLGRPTGIGRVLTTAAGYPAPAVVGAVGIWAALAGWGPLVLLALALMALGALVRARSAFTVLALLVVLAGDLAAWWFGDVQLVSALVCGVGAFLVLGAWRQLLNVVRSGDPGQDPVVLGMLTHLPRGGWIAVFVLVVGAFSAWSLMMLWPVLGGWLGLFAGR